MEAGFHGAFGTAKSWGGRMTLGELIDELKKQPNPHRNIPLGFGHPHSYRGYYDQLAFSPLEQTTIIGMLKCAEASVGRTFTGWKGGQYKMDRSTEVHIAETGNTGEELGPIFLSFILGKRRDD